ncbi:MAG: NADP-dependent malic enzyme, partial [Alphaproteobacteria bacterium]
MQDIYKKSSEYHRKPTPGKLSVTPTKPLSDQHDLVLAYSPGVAGPCLEIAEDPTQAAFLTARANLIAVVTNGTAVLGLGDIGPLASKPVMEGKAVLFKKFAGVDVFDLELQQNDPDKLVEAIVALEPTFGGINLEDIKAPECFYIEKQLQEKLKIPVFHDDQHGTAIIVGAAVLNGLQVLGKDIGKVKLVTSGAGAAAIACLDLLIDLGLNPNNIIVTDRSGVVYKGRPGTIDSSKANHEKETKLRTLQEALVGADVFLGLSTGNIVTKEMIAGMDERPLILALANPSPEISPEAVSEVRPQAIMATGRGDYPNQVNNVLCFPYIFRGALDVGATKINQEMKIACVHALAKLAQAESSDVVSGAYGGEIHRFGPEYIIPKPFDPRLIVELSSAVAEAAMNTGVATRPLKNLEAYRQRLGEFVYRSDMLMRPIFTQAKKQAMRLTLVEGEEPRILQATQMLVDEGVAHPILIGRPNVIQRQISILGLRLRPEIDFSWIDPNQDPRYAKYWKAYHKLLERKGVSPDGAKIIVRTDNTVIGALTVYLGDSDAVLCGPNGSYSQHLKHLTDVLGLAGGHQV